MQGKNGPSQMEFRGISGGLDPRWLRRNVLTNGSVRDNPYYVNRNYSINCYLMENNRLISVKQNAIFDVPAHRAGEYDFFQVAAFVQQVVQRIAVGNADDVLLDDGAVVEDFGDVVAGGADQLYAAGKGLMVGFGAHKSWQERMVNIDDALRILIHELIGEDLHVAGQHNEIRVVLSEQRQDFFLSGKLVVLGDRHGGIGNLIEVGNRLIVLVIGNDQRNIAGQFAVLMAVKKIHQAVIVLGDENHHLLPMARLGEPPIHLEFSGDWREVFVEVVQVDIKVCGIEFHAHQEEI